MLELAPEIHDKILSYLSYLDVYRIRSVSKLWKQLCEYHLYLRCKTNERKLYVKLEDDRGRTTIIDMTPFHYDPEHQVIEFTPCSHLKRTLEPRQRHRGAVKKLNSDDDNDNNDVDTAYFCRRGKAQIIFGEWCEREANSKFMDRLDLADRAHVLFHLQFNPSLQQVYEISPSSPSVCAIPSNSKHTGSPEGEERVHYIGDKGMIMTYSCRYLTDKSASDMLNDYQQNSQWNERDSNDSQRNGHYTGPQLQGINDPLISSSFNSLFSDILAREQPLPSPLVCVRIHSVHVNLSWLLAGINPDIIPEPIYAKRYKQLAKEFERYKKKDYMHLHIYSETVLKYLLTKELDEHLFELESTGLLQDTRMNNALSRRETVQMKLEKIRVDPRVVWKYTFAKNYILDGGISAITSNEVVDMIQRAEEEWMVKKLNIIRQLRSYF